MGTNVQSQLAGAILNQFHVSIGLNLQSKLQDWSGRQSIQYGSMKGLMNADWHSLSDFQLQLSLYSSTHAILEAAWQVIKSMVPNNPQMLLTLLHIPGFGLVGQQVLSLVGISSILVAPQNILQNTNQFQSTIGSISTSSSSLI